MKNIIVKKSSAIDYVNLWGELSKQDRYYREIEENIVDYYIIYKDNDVYGEFGVNKTTKSLFWIDIKFDSYSVIKDILTEYGNIYIEISKNDRRVDIILDTLKDNNYEIVEVVDNSEDNTIRIYFKG